MSTPIIVLPSSNSERDDKERPIRVLHVDDEAGFLKVSKQILEMQGPFQVDSALSVKEALERLREKAIDVVVSDYMMPEKDGLEFLKELREGGNNIPFIMFTGKGREDVAIEALNLGADRYFSKIGKQETVYGKLAQVICTVVKGKKAEKELEQIFDLSPDMVCVCTTEGELLKISPSCEKILGYTQEELLKIGWSKLVHPDDVEPTNKEVERQLNGSSVANFVNRYRRKDGSYITLEWQASFAEKGIVHATARDITERKKAEEALRSSEERLKILFDFAPDAYYLNDLKGNFVDGNRAAEALMGYNKEELIGKSFLSLKLLSRKQILKATKLLTKNLLGKPTGPDEFVLNRKDGTQVPVEIRTFPVKIKDQTRVLGIARDITERKKAEEEIRSLAKFPGENPNPVLRVAKDGTVLFANAAAKRKLKKEKSAVGKLVLVRDRQLVSDVLKSGLNKEVEIEHDNKTFSFVFAPVTEAGYVNVYGRDITERKKAEEEVRFYSDQMEELVKERTRQIESIFASSPDSIIVLDLNGNIVDCNRSTLELIGFSSKEELIGKSMFELTAEKDHEKAKIEQKKIIQQKLSRDVEYTLITRDGHEFPAEVSSSVLSDASGNPSGFVTVVNDITERKKLDTMKSQFISRAAHELKTPLISIKGYVDYIRTGTLGPVPEKIESSLKVVKRNTDRLISLTNDLLDIQYLQSGKLHLNLETLNFRKVIDNCVGEVQLFLNEKKQKLRLEVPEDRLLIRGDRVRLSQVLINLLNNAIKSTPEGGNITLRVGDDEGAIQVQVSDTGIGFTKEEMEMAFQPFAEGVTRYTRGTGLSLSLTKGLVEAHGGKIFVHSEGEGKGTTFTFTLPKQGKKEAETE